MAEPRVVDNSKNALPPIQNYCVSVIQRSNAIYQFSLQFDSGYVGHAIFR